MTYTTNAIGVVYFDGKSFVPIIVYSTAALAEAAFTRMAICPPRILSSSYLETETVATVKF